MNIDSYFCQGSTHRICQDYAVHNDEIVVISDGCSSAPYSDIGARILVHSLLKEKDLTWRMVLDNAEMVTALLNLPVDCLTATTLTLIVEDDKFIATMIGDGAIVSRRRCDGGIEVFNLTMESGAPYYIRYDKDGMYEQYMSEFGDSFSVNGELQSQGLFAEYPNGLIVKEYPTEDYDMVAIMSDGINSFVKRVNTPTSLNTELVPADEIIKELMNIKGFAGSFLQRRCNKALTKLKEEFCQNTDDFSMGVIKI